MSNDVVWNIVKRNSSFLYKDQRRGVNFTSEKGNLTNISRRKDSAFANVKAVDIAPARFQEKGVVFSIKSAKKGRQNKPNKLYSSVVLKKDFRKVARTIRATLKGYSPRLTRNALVRWSKLSKIASNTRKGTKKTQATPATQQ